MPRFGTGGGGSTASCIPQIGVGLNLYLAGDGGPMTWAFSSNGGGFDHGIASRVNMLESFYYVQPWQTELIPYLKSFLLDSGGYTLRRGKGDVTDWDSYLTRYIDYINRNDVRLFFDLDIDGEVGYRGVLRFRERLERETGKRSIPVWHMSYGKQEWLDLCDEYGYVALGGLAHAAGRRQMEKYVPWFLSEAHKRGTKVHILGYTPAGNLMSCGADSVDSSAWLYGNRGRFIYRWDGRTMRKIDVPEGKRMVSREVARHNFIEWVKMGEALETAS